MLRYCLLVVLAVTFSLSHAVLADEAGTSAAPAAKTWTQLGDQIAAADPQGKAVSPATATPASVEANVCPEGYIPWRQRQGPAYPGDFWKSFGRYGKEELPTLWDDTKATFTNPFSLIMILGAGAAGITLSATGVDNTFEDHFHRYGPQLNSFWDSVGDAGGNPGTHFALAGTMYFTSLAADDKVNYEKATTLINALVINDLFTLGLKGLTHTRSPNGDRFGWPSGHTSSSFTTATVLMEEYGPCVGIPAFLFAGYVGYERLDAGNHDFSDVISGALIGIAIGHAVTQNHLPRINGFQVVPMVDPATGTYGVALEKKW